MCQHMDMRRDRKATEHAKLMVKHFHRYSPGKQSWVPLGHSERGRLVTTEETDYRCNTHKRGTEATEVWPSNTNKMQDTPLKQTNKKRHRITWSQHQNRFHYPVHTASHHQKQAHQTKTPAFLAKALYDSLRHSWERCHPWSKRSDFKPPQPRKPSIFKSKLLVETIIWFEHRISF